MFAMTASSGLRGGVCPSQVAPSTPALLSIAGAGGDESRSRGNGRGVPSHGVERVSSALIASSRAGKKNALRMGGGFWIFVDAAAGLAAQPSGFDVLDQKRSGTIFVAERFVQILENVQPRVEADEID